MKKTMQQNPQPQITRKFLNERRSNLSREETKRNRKKLRRIEAVCNVLKEKEQTDRLTSRIC